MSETPTKNTRRTTRMLNMDSDYKRMYIIMYIEIAPFSWHFPVVARTVVSLNRSEITFYSFEPLLTANISVHVVNSPVLKSAQTLAPQSPAFATRSRVIIKDKVNKLINDLDGQLKKSSSKGSARKHPTIVPSVST